MTQGVVTFDFTAEATHDDVTGFTASDSDLLDGHVIIDQITNNTNEVQYVNYTIIPRSLATGCADGQPVTVTVAVNPTPVAEATFYNDTICTYEYADFYLTTPSTMSSGVVTFDYTAVATGNPGDVTGYITSDNNLPDGYNLRQSVANNTLEPQYVTYTIIPHAHDTGCDPGNPIEVTIRINPYPIADLYVSEELECVGAHTGSIALDTAEGSGPYSFSWVGPDNFVSNEQNLIDISYGQYIVTATDANNCTAINSIYLSNPDDITFSFNLGDVSCYGGSDGHVLIETVDMGGGPPYSFEWFGPDGFEFDDNTDRDQTGLIAGEYFVIVTDGKDCIYDSRNYWEPGTFKINEPTELEVEIEGFDTSCNINDDGKAISTVTGGAPPYSYYWTGPAGHVFADNTTPNQEDMMSGEYTLIVTDGNGCEKSADVYIGELPPFNVTAHITSDYNGYSVSCFGASDGSIELEIEGEFPPFDIFWSSGHTSETLTNIPAGEYHVIVYDSVDCPSEATVVLTEPERMELDVVVNDVSCYGDRDGEIHLFASGGTGVFYYSWEDGQASDIAFGMEAGNHFVRVSDQNNCYIDTSIYVSQPNQLEIHPVVNEPYCSETDDGSIELNTTGGTSPYFFNWSTGETTENIYFITEGSYTVTIEDFNNCILVETILVNAEKDLCVNIPNAFTPNDDGFNDYWFIGDEMVGMLGDIYPYAVVEVYNRWGEMVFKSQEGYPDPWDGTKNGVPLPMDSYHYVIYLNNGSPPISGNIAIIR